MYGTTKCLIAKGYYWPNTRSMKTNWTRANIPAQVGRRAVITGANSGIGFEAALALARKGAELILPARSQAKADNAAARIRPSPSGFGKNRSA